VVGVLIDACKMNKKIDILTSEATGQETSLRYTSPERALSVSFREMNPKHIYVSRSDSFFENRYLMLVLSWSFLQVVCMPFFFSALDTAPC